MSTIPSALPAINTLLAIGSAGCPQTFQTIANVGDMGGPSFSADTVDVTSHSNDNPWDQWVTTLLRGGEVPIPLFFIPSSGANPGGQFGHGASSGLMSVFTGRELRRYRLIFPDAAATTNNGVRYFRSRSQQRRNLLFVEVACFRQCRGEFGDQLAAWSQNHLSPRARVLANAFTSRVALGGVLVNAMP